MHVHRRLLPILAILLSLALAAPVVARPRGGAHGLGKLEHRIEKLDLDAAVRDQAYAILDAARDDERALRREIHTAHDQLRALLDAEAPDVETALAQADALGALRTSAHKLALRTRLEVMALLTPEQREALQQERQRHRGERRDAWLR